MTYLERLEFWSDLQVRQGVRWAAIPHWLDCRETVNVDGTNRMTLSLLRDNPALATLSTPAGELNGDLARVLRAVYGDGTRVERRIETLEEENRQGEARVAITAHDLFYELGIRGMVYRPYVGGRRSYHFQASSQTARQHLTNYILPALWEAGQPFWAAGTLETDDEAVTVAYDMDSPLAGLRKLVTAHHRPLELEVEYDEAAARYRIHLLQQRGIEAPPVRIRAGMGVVRLGVARTLRDTVNRVYGFGASDPEAGRATLASNMWLVTNTRFDAVGNLYIALADIAGGAGPIAFNGQFTGDPAGRHRLVSLNPAGGQWYITSSDAETQEFRVQVAQSGSIVGWYRIAAPTQELAYVERRPAPSGRDFGVRAGFVERPEVTGTVNFIDNPISRRLSVQAGATLPDNWAAVGTPNTSLEINPLYVRSGVRSVRVTFTDLGQRIIIAGTGNGYMADGSVSYYATVMTLAGRVQASALLFLNGVQTFPDGQQNNTVRYPDRYLVMNPGTTSVPYGYQTEQRNQWERMGIEAVHSATRYVVREGRIEMQPVTVPATCIIDAGQLTNTTTFRDLVEGGGGSALLQAANALLLASADYAEAISVDTLDLGSVDDQMFPFHNYVVGGRIEVVDPVLDKVVRTRVYGWERNWLLPEELTLQVASSRGALSRVLASREATVPPPL